MSDLAFILAVLAIGVGYFIIFERMKRNWRDRHPGEKGNPIQRWLTGREGEDKD